MTATPNRQGLSQSQLQVHHSIYCNEPVRQWKAMWIDVLMHSDYYGILRRTVLFSHVAYSWSTSCSNYKRPRLTGPEVCCNPSGPHEASSFISMWIAQVFIRIRILGLYLTGVGPLADAQVKCILWVRAWLIRWLVLQDFKISSLIPIVFAWNSHNSQINGNMILRSQF